MPVTLASVFALFNDSLTRMIVAPIAGTTSDHVFKGAANSMRIALATMICIIIVILIIPRNTGFVTIAMVLLLLCTVMVSFLRPL